MPTQQLGWKYQLNLSTDDVDSAMDAHANVKSLAATHRTQRIWPVELATARDLALSRSTTRTSSHTILDIEPPNGGWPRGALVEVLFRQACIGEIPLYAAVSLYNQKKRLKGNKSTSQVRSNSFM